jgi:hypothetical protein
MMDHDMPDNPEEYRLNCMIEGCECPMFVGKNDWAKSRSKDEPVNYFAEIVEVRGYGRVEIPQDWQIIEPDRV